MEDSKEMAALGVRIILAQATCTQMRKQGGTFRRMCMCLAPEIASSNSQAQHRWYYRLVGLRSRTGVEAVISSKIIVPSSSANQYTSQQSCR